MKSLLLLAISALLLLTFACRSGNQPASQTTSDPAKTAAQPAQMASAMFNMDVQPVFTGKCALADCHGAAKSGGMQLSAGMAYDNIVNVKSSEDPRFMRVMPGAPDSSYLVMKIEGRQTVGVRMPFRRTPLSDSQIQLIRGWIQAGAKKD
jgi:hypothetical protein